MKQKKNLRRPVVFKIEYSPKLYFALEEFFDDNNINLMLLTSKINYFYEPYFKQELKGKSIAEGIITKVKLNYIQDNKQFTSWFDLLDSIYDFWNKYPEKYPFK